MRAATIYRYGGAVGLSDLPPAPLGPGDLRVAVLAAGVNPVDYKIRDGKLRLVERHRMPQVLGNEVAGVVIDAGADSHGFRVGDEVFARLEKNRLGGFADEVVMDARVAAHKPTTISYVQAAALPLAALTAWQALTEFGRIGAGQTMLIHAGSGGVGTVAIQLAKHLGARVATTASAKNFPLLRSLGADILIDYRTQSFVRELGAVDLVLDTQGGDVLRQSFDVLKPGGTLVTVGGVPTPGSLPGRARPLQNVAFWLAHSGTRRLARRYGVRFHYLYMRPDGRQLSELVDRAVLRPVIDRVYPLEQVADALAHVEAGRTVGKVVVTTAPQP